MNEKKCIVCDKKAPANCSACFKVAYCSVEHQKQHWNVHRKDCSYFKIVEDPEFPELGKGFLATRDIKAGTIILEESPLVFSCWAEQPSCIACGFIFTRAKPAQKCGKCQWPVCSEKCPKMTVHADNECKLFVSNKGFKLTHMSDQVVKSDIEERNVVDLFLAMIRALLLKKNGSEIYQKILELQSEYSIPGFRAVGENCFKAMKSALTSLDLNVEDEEFLRLFNIFHINWYISSVPYDDSTCSTSALYFKASRMNHSCVPNCDWRVSQPPGSKLRVRTVVNIRKGEPLTTAYNIAKMILVTKKRQTAYLRAGFQCKCKRCLDPTELGTYLSAVVCNSCRSESKVGYFLPENPLNLSDDSSWKCNSCGRTKPASELIRPIEKVHEAVLSKLSSYVESLKGDALIKMCRSVEDKYSGKSVHPNHWLIQECWGAVVDYFSIPELALTLDLASNTYVIDCGYRLLAIYDAVIPGWSLCRAQLQRRIAGALEFQQFQISVQSVSEEQLESLNKALEFYKESLKYFEGDFLRNDDVKSEANIVRSYIQRIENAFMMFSMERMSFLDFTLSQ